MIPLADGLRYGAIAAPLAFAALPLYVLLPSHYGASLGVPLAALGTVLLLTRLLDALVDPWLGRFVDRRFGPTRTRAMQLAGGAAVLLALGLAALFFPPMDDPRQLLLWCGLSLVVTYLGYSALGVLHQAWGARLGGDASTQAAVMGWREGIALAGVLLASVLPALAGLGAMVATCAVGLGLGWLALSRAPYRSSALPAGATKGQWSLPWRQAGFRHLIAVFLLNGVASAIPATLVLFFVRDRLQSPALEPVFLGGYFAAGALSMPLWVRAVRHFGLVRTWLAGMLMAIVSFAGAATLGAGDGLAFVAICVASGVALGADLVAPAALLTGVIQRAGHAQRLEGSYAGWWTCVTKLNLALAAGAALPALQWLGYRPGTTDPAALQALTLCYSTLPCLLKAAAALLLWRSGPTLEGRTT
ncbi:MFS transporter [Ideonella sp. A 288]|uniref:MFS transporter n=1 Tax=Ideonella sp. A 288 TaxID=1962181 RepID=UPI002872F94C|nr:MFS transporter [Ideonella sp. A 288]